jgi:hypothetical protein
MGAFSDIIKYARFAFDLRSYLNSTITLEQTEQTIIWRIGQRQNNFLHLLRKAIFQHPESPYLLLFKMAGCEYPDIESMVKKDGIESTLEHLYRKGVYLSWEEFKGKQDVIRGNNRFRFNEADFDNPFLPRSYQVETSGSRSSGTRISFDLNHRAQESYYHLLLLAANDALNLPIVMWKPVPPSASGIGNLLIHWKIGQPITKWYSPVDENQIQTPWVHRFALRYIIYCGKMWGARLAFPEVVSLKDAPKVARWIADVKRTSGVCSLNSSVSPAVMVAEAALKYGYDISGAHFFVSGEPLTDDKLKRLEMAGALIAPRYSIAEIGRIGIGCSQRHYADEVHFLHDTTALIQHPRTVKYTDMEVNAFLYTSLLPASPKILVNVESDDYGEIEKRECDCLLGKLGFNYHIHNIRSFAKLTGSGMTIIGTDLVHTLEETLPHKFGGGPTDYQLLEEEDSKNQTRLSLIVSPAVGEINEPELIAVLLQEMRKNASGGKLAAGMWAQIDTIRVKRIYPLSRAGKVMTLHLLKKSEA